MESNKNIFQKLTGWLKTQKHRLANWSKTHKKAAKALTIISVIILLMVGNEIRMRVMEAREQARYRPGATPTQQQQHPGGQTPPKVLTTAEQTAAFRFKRFPFDIEHIASIAPIGEFGGITRQTVANSHFYGNYRNYVFSKNPGQYDYNVYAPADAKITGFRNSDVTGQYRFTFEVSSKSFFYIDHIQSLSSDMKAKLKAQFGDPLRTTQGVEQVSPGIEVKAGTVLGQTGKKGIAWDWGFIDGDYCTDIIHPEHYAQDQCPRSVYDFFTDDMKTQIAPLAGYWAAPPMGMGLLKVHTQWPLGHYAHDKAGTLSGGWLQEDRSYKNIFIVPDAYEANALTIRLAIPDLSVLGVWNNLPIGTTTNPDPLKVTPASGIVGYVLAKNKARDTTEYGVLLVRVNNDETVTVETLKNATTVPANPSFTAKAVTLHR